jgi:hypothetical protein
MFPLKSSEADLNVLLDKLKEQTKMAIKEEYTLKLTYF